jgi:molybdopterin synthase catalytic subunit
VVVRIQEHPFDPGAELNAFTAEARGAGAVVSFSGIVRDIGPDRLEQLIIEHYPGMTERSLKMIEAKARARWSLTDSLILHRHGTLTPGEPIMMVATASAHRHAAFEAAEFLMDYLKSRAPFWKQEVSGGGAAWVDARATDAAALERWNDRLPNDQ